MNPVDETRPISDEHRFDLLADGELSEPERRALLSRLDDEPGGWRRCALAFLEGQSWKEDLGAMVDRPAGQSTARRPARWLRLSGPAGTLLAMAASFAVALVLGSMLQGLWWAGSPTVGPRINEMVAEGRPAEVAPNESPAESPHDIPPELPDTSPGKVWLVEFPGLDGEGETIRLPAIERDQLGEGWPAGLPSPMSPEVLERLREAGLQVEHRRELLPLRVSGGRPLVVPVDEVDIRYVGNRTY